VTQKRLPILALALFISAASCSSGGGSSHEPTEEVVADAPAEVTADLPDDPAIDLSADLPPDGSAEASVDTSADTLADGTSEGDDDALADVPADVPAEVAYPDLNGCAKATAQDDTGQASVTITFGVGGYTFSPACLVVSAGTKLVFEGTFSFHPLVGGSDGVPDAASPFEPMTASGTSAEFTVTEPGAYGFYCQIHVGLGMMGAVYVE